MAPSSGSGSSLPAALLHVSLGCTLFATLASFWSIYLHLKGYRRPALQRLVVRIMIMIPLYAISSLVSLHSLEAAFWIDAVRDLYEAFVIYTFFSLLVTYLGGERSLLILLHGRPPTLHPFPVSIFIHEMDGSDPYTYLGLKRGILQYVWVKPILALVTLVLKLTDTYADGKLSFSTPYTYVSIVYNISICLSLYCLAMFWVAILEDVKPFRPTPKFLCVKGILFFSFWQGIFVSVLVASGIITKVGVYTDAEHMSLALGDLLICFEMPLFAIAHAYAFCRLDDYVDPTLQYVARMPFLLALRDAAGLLDVYFDFKSTVQGKGMSYRSFEPAEGAVHSLGLARERRIRAGLRYEGGGKGKYWLPVPRGDGGILGGVGRDYGSLGNSSNPPPPPTTGVYNKNGHGPHSKGYRSPPLPSSSSNSPPERIEDSDDETDSVTSLEFFALPNDSTATNGEREELEVEEDEKLYEHARSMLHGDWAYRVVDVSREEARRKMREEEENVLRGYGRDGRGRRTGEVWGRGLPGRRARGDGDGEGNGTTDGKKKDPKKVYGAYHDEERLIDSIYPSIGRKSKKSKNASPPPSPPNGSSSSAQAIFDGDEESPSAWRAPMERSSSSNHSPHSLVSPLPEPREDPIRLLWTSKGKEVVDHLKEAASHLPVPQTSLQFSRPSSPSESHHHHHFGARSPSPGPAPGEEGAVLPDDAVDLVVEDRSSPNGKRLSSGERDGGGSSAGLDEAPYFKADFIERERERGKVVQEEEKDGTVIARATGTVPLLHISPPSSPPPPPPPTASSSSKARSSSPWFDNARRQESEDSNPWQ